jgi:hypothetical protein
VRCLWLGQPQSLGQNFLAQLDPLGDSTQMIFSGQLGQDNEDQHCDEGIAQTSRIAMII